MPVRTGTENLEPTGILSPNGPGRSEWLYRLSCPNRPSAYYVMFHYSHIIQRHIWDFSLGVV
jgi:hypothetical protein